MNPYSLRSKLHKRVMENLGIATKILRAKEVAKDLYGEPIETPWPFDEYILKIVIDSEKIDQKNSSVGSGADPKKEYIYFYCDGDFDIRVGDKLVYPANSTSQWFVDFIEPVVLRGVPIICEVKAYKDDRY